MKSFPNQHQNHAFSLVEILFVLAIFSLVVAAMVSSQLFGLRVNKAASVKLIATAGARHTMDQVRDRVRNANAVYVGTWNGSFLAITNGQRQEGNALQIFSSTNTSMYYLYYRDNTNLNQLSFYYGSATNGVYRTLADNVTNQIIFDVEDYQGNVLTNNQNNRIIRMTLEFYQFEYASGQRGNAYNHYRVQMRATQRLLN